MIPEFHHRILIKGITDTLVYVKPFENENYVMYSE